VSKHKSICTSGCGNGRKGPDEECDDGNFINGDGCDYKCGVERGFSCAFEDGCVTNCKSVCKSICGDGIIAANEECDDGNTDEDDGCSSHCTVETAKGNGKDTWICVGEPSKCTHYYGNEFDISINNIVVEPVGCNGDNTGSVSFNISSTNGISWSVGLYTICPNGGAVVREPQVTDVFRLLPAGTYCIYGEIEGLSSKNFSAEITIKQPEGLRTSPAYRTLQSLASDFNCYSDTGKFVWPVLGGNARKNYTFGPYWNTDGKFKNLPVSVLFNYRPRVIDEKGCMLDLEDSLYNQFPSPDKVCDDGLVAFVKESWASKGSVGISLVACAFVIAIALGVGYCCWSNDKQVPANARNPPK